ncbi:tautomerase family protein [Cognatilysobacter bugurensis]|uniref:Tautomerase n=1 Tax=Cognatilysobacter bugurensis TaxID=543356 RepID=A0A918SZK2_9GAMM|nr:4-oxalocrotonate tautomerase family protein [Lysobacter bugurensis]GHA76874.1 tautomerase [Lysobacter bugurensis]
MPYIHIRITREGVTREQKAKLIAGATNLVVDVLGKDPMTTHVVIDEVDPDNWGVAGLAVPEFRKRGR